MLNEKNKNYFKKLLTQMLNESLGKAHDTLADISDLRDKFPDAVDQASLSFDMGFTLRIRDREAKLIGKITEALERMEEGRFGICEECGDEIPLKRLMARPVTTLCIECKRAQEADERIRQLNSQLPEYREFQKAAQGFCSGSQKMKGGGRNEQDPCD
jgi:DnaK suppressor protein